MTRRRVWPPRTQIPEDTGIVVEDDDVVRKYATPCEFADYMSGVSLATLENEGRTGD